MEHTMTSEHKTENMGAEASPIDEMIAQVDSYIKDPKLVTGETLTDLKSKLEDLKNYLDSDSSEEPEKPSEQEMKGRPALSIMIGMHRRGGKSYAQ